MLKIGAEMEALQIRRKMMRLTGDFGEVAKHCESESS
jgi:hypothetical protein